MNTIQPKRMMDLISGTRMPINKNEELFVDGYNHGFAETLLKDVLTEDPRMDTLEHHEFISYIMGYAVGQAYYKSPDEDEPNTLQ